MGVVVGFARRGKRRSGRGVGAVDAVVFFGVEVVVVVLMVCGCWYCCCC